MTEPAKKTLAQKAADRALDEACVRVVEVYGMLPEESTMIDVIDAYRELCDGIMAGAINFVRGMADGQVRK